MYRPTKVCVNLMMFGALGLGITPAGWIYMYRPNRDYWDCVEIGLAAVWLIRFEMQHSLKASTVRCMLGAVVIAAQPLLALRKADTNEQVGVFCRVEQS